MTRTTTTLTELARLGFADLGAANDALASVPAGVVPLFAAAADPDQALRFVGSLREVAPDAVAGLLRDEAFALRLLRVLGASEGMAAFLVRHPEQLDAFRAPLTAPLPAAKMTSTSLR